MANLELRSHWSPSALLPDEPEVRCGSYAQTWPKAKSRNGPKCTEIPRGPSKRLGNCISGWTLVPREEIKITSSRYSHWGKEVWCEGSTNHLITGSLSPWKLQFPRVCELFLQQRSTVSGSDTDSVLCFSSNCQRLSLALLIPGLNEKLTLGSSQRTACPEDFQHCVCIPLLPVLFACLEKMNSFAAGTLLMSNNDLIVTKTLSMRESQC